MLNATDPIIQGTPGHDCIISTRNESAVIYGLGGRDIIVSLVSAAREKKKEEEEEEEKGKKMMAA